MTDNYAIQELGVALAELKSRVVTGYDKLNRRISALESRMNARFEEAEAHARKRHVEGGSRVEGVSSRFKQVSYALDELGTRLDKGVEELDAEVRKQFDVLQVAVDAIGEHFADLK